ncbi:MAG: glycosyltransferase family 4 protein [Alphaproteobacteria bacterium]|nr:glycosyltransferase family 4 protein [Alphaproteobacteria bacterium]
MNIMQILRAPVGGLLRHVADLGEGLADRGHAVALVTGGPATPAEARHLAALERHFSLGIHTVPLPRVFSLADLLAPKRISRLANSLDIDVLHGHGAKGGFHARLAARNRAWPVFYTPHGGVLHYSPKSISGKVFFALERAQVQGTEKIIFESEFARTAFAKVIADPKERGTVIYNGLRKHEFNPVVSAGEFTFGFVGELRKLKGLDVLLDALHRIGETGDMPTLVVAGDGPDRLEFEARARGGNVPKSAVFCGFQPAMKIFERADCIIVPSRKESLPYIVLEAAAAGKPMIATRTGGIAEIFGPTEATLVEPGHVGALAAEMERWLNTPDALIAEAEIRREHVRKTFALSTMVDAIKALYGEALSLR